MKNVSIVLNVILLVAVSILYYLHFSKGESEQSLSSGETVKIEDAMLVYVNSDSIVANFDFIKDKQKELEAKGKKLDAEYKNRAQGLQTELNNYQQNASSLTIGQARAVEEDLMKKQQNLRIYEQSLMQELANDEARIAQELYSYVSKAVADYGQENNIQVVVKYNQGSDILYANAGMDITNAIIDRLNSNYENGNLEAGVETSDSTAVN